jgi:hypothetical protein
VGFTCVSWFVSTSALAAVAADVSAGAGALSSGGASLGLGNMLQTIINWLQSGVHQVLVLAGLGIGLALAFNKNFLQLAEQVAYFAVIATLLAFVMGGLGGGAAGALVP